MAKTIIHLVRHAQGYHNLSVANQGLRDPRLTPLGEQQCAGLRASFPHHHRITHLVASPMRRTLYTCLLGFAADPPRPPRRPHAPVGSDDYHLAESDAAPAGVDAATLPGTGNGPKLGFAQPVIALPWVQEVSDLPCDVGSALSVLRAEFEETTVDLSQVPDDWTDKSSPGSHWRPEIEAIEARAKVARRWLRDLGRKWAEEQGNADRDAEIVVVTHGGFVHFLSGDWEGMEWGSATAWRNAEFRSYTFTADSDDDNPTLVETEESFRRRCGENASRPTDADQTRMAAIAKARLAQELADIGKHRDAIRRAVAEAALAKERGASD